MLLFQRSTYTHTNNHTYQQPHTHTELNIIFIWKRSNCVGCLCFSKGGEKSLKCNPFRQQLYVIVRLFGYTSFQTNALRSLHAVLKLYTTTQKMFHNVFTKHWGLTRHSVTLPGWKCANCTFYLHEISHIYSNIVIVTLSQVSVSFYQEKITGVLAASQKIEKNFDV